MDQESLKLNIVLPKRLNIDSETVDLVKVHVAVFSDKKQISPALKYLAKEYPLPSLLHLKRVNSEGDRFKIIVALAQDDEDAILDALKEQEDSRNCTFEITEVPSRAPLIRSQNELAKKYWPTNFRENKYIAGCIDGACFTSEEKSTITTLIKTLMELQGKEKGQEAALVASGPKIVSSAVSQSHVRPLDHAVKTLIDSMASSQLAAKHTDEGDDTRADPEGPKYLCTDCDVYLTCEPCILCAMMLTHSRVKRLFYLDGRNCGEPGISHFEINSLPSLNHRYEAWRISIDSPKPQ